MLPDLLFVLLAVYNAIRLFRHAMWRDELQAFMVAAASNTPLDLFAKLKYEGHPGLWHLLLWVVTRFTSDPVAMRVLHLVIALGDWCWSGACLCGAPSAPPRAALLAMGAARPARQHTVFGTIWSFGLGLFYALRNRQEWRLMLPGVAL